MLRLGSLSNGVNRCVFIHSQLAPASKLVSSDCCIPLVLVGVIIKPGHKCLYSIEVRTLKLVLRCNCAISKFDLVEEASFDEECPRCWSTDDERDVVTGLVSASDSLVMLWLMLRRLTLSGHSMSTHLAGMMPFERCKEIFKLGKLSG